MDFVETWVEVLSECTDANRELLEASGLLALSTVVNNVVIPVSTDIRPFSSSENVGKKLNLWFLVIGRTRVSRKTTIMKFIEDFIYNNLGPEYLCSYIATPEALVEELSLNTHRVWLVDEFAIPLEMCSKKDYMAAFQGILQKLYDGTSFTWRTRGRGLVKIENPYFTVWASTTPFSVKEKLINEKMFIHGFLNRFIILWDEGTRQLVPIGKRMLRNGILSISNIKEIQEITHKLRKKDIMTIWYDGETLELLNEFDSKVHEQIKTLDNEVILAYYGNLTDFILKLSALYRIARITEKELDSSTIIARKEDFRKAYNFIKAIVLPSFEKLKQEMKLTKTAVSAKVEKIEDLVDIVWSVVKKYGKKQDDYYVIDRTTLYRKFYKETNGYDAETLTKVLNTLINMEFVEKRIEKTKGRPKIVYYFKPS